VFEKVIHIILSSIFPPALAAAKVALGPAKRAWRPRDTSDSSAFSAGQRAIFSLFAGLATKNIPSKAFFGRFCIRRKQSES